MAKLISPLSDLKIKNAKPTVKQYALFDGNGLHVLVQPTGTKIFKLKANINGKGKRITLGKCPVLDLAARELWHAITSRKSRRASILLALASTLSKVRSNHSSTGRKRVGARLP